MDNRYLIGGLVLLGLVGLLYYFFYRNSEDYANPHSNEKKNLILFYSPNCGHCKTFMEGSDSTWNVLKNKHSDKILFTEVNCDEEPTLATQHEITSYPTIKLMTENRQSTYNGDRSLESLEQFLTE